MRKFKIDKEISTKLSALAAAGFISVTSILVSSCSKKEENQNESSRESISQTEVSDTPVENNSVEETIKLDDIGVEEDLSQYEEQTKEFGEVTGDINKEEIVEKDDTLWKDEETANKSDEIGKETFDDKNDTLKKDEDGDIVEKEEHFEIKDESGSEVSTGANETGIPEDYVWDSVLNKYVKKEDAGKFVYADATYYDTEGNIVIQKGVEILKETFEKIKNDSNLTTTKPEESKPEESKPENSNPTDDLVDSYGGTINKDGTYTIYGLTYMDKATFEAFIQDENRAYNFGFYNNIIYPNTVIDEMLGVKTK